MPEVRQEDQVRTATAALATACALSAAVIAAGCGGNGDTDTAPGGEVLLQPVAEQGPDPFTRSTATSTATPTPASGTSRPATASGPRSVPGGTPGLYGGTERVGSCDVEGQIGRLTSDRSKARAFARAEGISEGSVPAYLRALAPVVLRADTRVTDHGFRSGRATSFPSVLQAGTAVLVDGRGMPRVRCACGNPLGPPVAERGHHGTNGRPWPGYRPTDVIVVTPAPRVISSVTIIDVAGDAWIERPIGHDVHHDHVVPPPEWEAPAPTPTPSPDGSEPGTSTGLRPAGTGASPSGPVTGCATPAPAVTVTPGATDHAAAGEPPLRPTACPTAPATATPRTAPGVATPAPGRPSTPSAETGPATVPDAPDLPDGGGLIPDDTGGSIFDSPTQIFDG